MSDLLPVPTTSFVCDDPSSSEFGLWCEREGPYTADDMRQYAAACVAAERERCARICDDYADSTRQNARVAARFLASKIRGSQVPNSRGSGNGWSIYGSAKADQ